MYVFYISSDLFLDSLNFLGKSKSKKNAEENNQTYFKLKKIKRIIKLNLNYRWQRYSDVEIMYIN